MKMQKLPERREVSEVTEQVNEMKLELFVFLAWWPGALSTLADNEDSGAHPALLCVKHLHSRDGEWPAAAVVCVVYTKVWNAVPLFAALLQSCAWG